MNVNEIIDMLNEAEEMLEEKNKNWIECVKAKAEGYQKGIEDMRKAVILTLREVIK